MARLGKRKKREKLLKEFGALKTDSFNFVQIEQYFRKSDSTTAFQVLSDKTCADLDFQELFMFVDRTTSTVGQQYLYRRLRTIPADSTKNEQQESLINEFTLNPELRIDVQSALAKVNGKEAYYISSLFHDTHIDPPKWHFIVPILSFTSVLSLLLLPFNLKMFFVLIFVFLVNSFIHYFNKRNIYQYLDSIPQLLRLSGVARDLFKYEALKKINPNLNQSIAIVDKVRNRMSFFQLEVKLQGDLQAMVWIGLEFVKVLFLIEPLMLFSVLKQLNTKRKEVEELFTFVGLVDTLISIASLRKGMDTYCIPTVTQEAKALEAIDAYHPLIYRCVENSISIRSKSVLLTGSNMSGKTSFIRAIGVNILTGLTLNTCFARQLTMPRMSIYSAIRISDDLMNDRSYYFEEVLTIKEMVDRSEDGSPNLFLLDEIFKGTNTIERISAGKAVLSALTRNANIVFVSTHDIELADLLKQEYDLYHFSEKVDGNTVDFDFRLKEGKLKNRNAIKILQLNSYPDSIIKEALELSKELDQHTLTQRSGYCG